MNFSRKINLLGAVTLLIFIPGGLLVQQLIPVNKVYWGENYFLQLLLGLISGIVAAFIGWNLVKQPFLNDTRTKFVRIFD